jgi:hypothetical protein
LVCAKHHWLVVKFVTRPRLFVRECVGFDKRNGLLRSLLEHVTSKRQDRECDEHHRDNKESVVEQAHAAMQEK